MAELHLLQARLIFIHAAVCHLEDLFYRPILIKMELGHTESYHGTGIDSEVIFDLSSE